MIRKLRRKFIAIAITSTALVLFLIIGAINIASFLDVNQTADELLQILSDSNGTFPKDPNDLRDERPDGFRGSTEPLLKDDERKDFHKRRGALPAEAPYNTRYFTVTLNKDGSVYSTDTSKIFATSSSQASEYALELYKKENIKGYLNYYRYLRTTVEEDGQSRYLYIFLDQEQELSTFRNFLASSVLVSLAGLLIVFALLLIFSGRAIKPVAESYAKQKQFITNAGHEIKTPLTIIDANTEILEMMGEENEWTRSIHNQVWRLTDLTEKMVFLSRMDEEQTQMTMIDFSLSDAVTETVEPFLAVARTTNRTLELSVEPQVYCHGDEANIRQVISLLVDNALKYSSESGVIRVTLKATSRHCRLNVWNTVEQIEPGNHDELFDRFYRRDSSRNTKTGGHGIGLSVAQAIILAHKGKISAKSEDGTSILLQIVLYKAG